MLAPARRQNLIPPPGHANRSPRVLPGVRPCWRRPPGKALSHRLTTPTGCPKSRLPAAHVGATLPAKPYPTAWPRQQGALKTARRSPMLAPPRRQGLIPPPGHANRSPRIPPGGRPCWRRPPGKTISHRLATPTFCPEPRAPAVHVGVAPPAKPYPTAWPRQQGVPNLARRSPMLAPPSRQSLIAPPGHANRASRILPGSAVSPFLCGNL